MSSYKEEPLRNARLCEIEGHQWIAYSGDSLQDILVPVFTCLHVSADVRFVAPDLGNHIHQTMVMTLARALAAALAYPISTPPL